jgi:hypothetical protein
MPFASIRRWQPGSERRSSLRCGPLALGGVPWLALALALFLVWTGPRAASGHAMPNSMISVAFEAQSAQIEATIPWAELAYALPPALKHPPGRADGAATAQLAAYALGHIGAATTDGRPWRLRIDALKVLPSADHSDLWFRLVATPPPGVSAESFILHDDAVTHVVMSHVIFVFVRRPSAGGEDAADPSLVGVLQNPTFDLAVRRLKPPPEQGFWAAFRLGARHIAEGTDHLLFLLTLLLPAPLASQAGRWSGCVPPRRALMRLISIVSAFTVGHSLTLILGAALNISVPQKPVEVLIAASILVAALEAWRPLVFAKAGPLIAGGFGLIHGMAFSAAIGEHLNSAWEKAEAIAGFNLGIEAVQMLIVLVVTPVLIFLARTRAYAPIRLVASAGAGCAAVVWVISRILA